MINREVAISTLKRYWKRDNLTFKAVYKEEIKAVFGKAIKIGRLLPKPDSFSELRYPTLNGYSYPRRVEIEMPPNSNLKNNQTYWVKLDLASDTDRKKANNPYLVKCLTLDPMITSKKNDFSKRDYASLQKQIETLKEETLDFSKPYQVINLGNSVKELSKGIYSEGIRFIYELVQNADDASENNDTKIHIQIQDGFVVLSHKGEPFSTRDLRGLCSVGAGNKPKDHTKTGYKGIGFKSVFGQPDGLVYVKSNDILFKFDKKEIDKIAWKSEWGNQKDWERINNTKFITPWPLIPIEAKSTQSYTVDNILKDKEYSVKTAIKIRDEQQMFLDIIPLFNDARILLFLRRVNEIILTFNGSQNSIRKEVDSENENIVSLYKNGQLVGSYFIYKRTIAIPSDFREKLQNDDTTPDKIKEMKEAEFSIAVALDENQGGIKVLKRTESPIYSYLPTSDYDYGLPVIVNGNFLLDSSRQHLSKDKEWNAWLFKIIGHQLVEVCAYFAENRLFVDTYLKLLENGYYENSNPLIKGFNAGLQIGFQQTPFILNNQEEIVKLQEICVDNFGLLENHIVKVEIIENKLREAGRDILAKNILKEDYRSEILAKYDALTLKEFPALLEKILLSEEFRSGITLKNNIRILEFMMEREKEDKSGRWYHNLLTNPFVFSSEMHLCNLDEICYPTNMMDQDPEFRNVLLHEQLYEEVKQKKELKDWLDKMGVKAPSSIAFLEKEIINKIPKSITEENYLSTTTYVLKQHLEGNLSKKHYLDLQQLPVKTKQGFKPANECILDKAYNPIFDFSIFDFPLNLVEKNYFENKGHDATQWKSLFIKIGVIQDIGFEELKIVSTKLDEEYVEKCYEVAKEGHDFPHLVSGERDFYIQSVPFLENVNSFEGFKRVWERIIPKYDPKFLESYKKKDRYREAPFKGEKHKLNDSDILDSLGSFIWGYFSTEIPCENYFNWLIKEKEIIPTKKGLRKASDVFINTKENIDLIGDYLPIADLDVEFTYGSAELLQLKTELSNKDIFRLLGLMNADLYKGRFVKKANETRIGKLYNLIITRLSDIKHREELIEVSQEWVKSNQLASSDFIPEYCENLLFTDEEHLRIDHKDYRTILIPKNVNRDASQFKNFLKLLNIHEVRDLEVESAGNKVNFKNKLDIVKLLPYVAFQLKDRLIITDIFSYLNKAVNEIKKYNFIRCNELSIQLIIGDEKIQGPEKEFHFDKANKSIYSIKPFEDILLRLKLANVLAEIFNAKKIAQELQFGLNLNFHQRKLIMTGNGLSEQDEYELFENQNYLDYIKELEEAISPPQPVNLIDEKPIDGQSGEKSGDKEDEATTHIVAEPSDNKEEYIIKDNIDDEEITIEKYLSKEEFEAFNKLFDLNLLKEEKEEWNAVAILLAFSHYALHIDDYIDKADKILKKRRFAAVIDGKPQMIFPRSARRNLLFVSPTLWEELDEPNSKVIVIGKNRTIIEFDSKEQLLEQDNNLIFKVGANWVGDRIEIADSLFQNEFIEGGKYDPDKEIFMIVRIDKKDEFDSIFD